MQVIVTATSSKVDDLILIETSTTIGEQTTTSRVGYNTEELMENRFLSGDLETRIEALRLGAEKMTTKGIELHFKTLMKILHKEPEVTEVVATPTGRIVKENPEIQNLPAEKKTRAKRQPKVNADVTNITNLPV
jgi:hypothetical protein